MKASVYCLIGNSFRASAKANFTEESKAITDLSCSLQEEYVNTTNDKFQPAHTQAYASLAVVVLLTITAINVVGEVSVIMPLKAFHYLTSSQLCSTVSKD